MYFTFYRNYFGKLGHLIVGLFTSQLNEPSLSFGIDYQEYRGALQLHVSVWRTDLYLTYAPPSSGPLTA